MKTITILTILTLTKTAFLEMNISCNAFGSQTSPAFHSGIFTSDTVSLTISVNCFAFWLTIDKKDLSTFEGAGAGSMVSENGAIWMTISILQNGSSAGQIFVSDGDITITESTAQTGYKHDHWYYMTANSGDTWTMSIQTSGLRTTCSTLVGNQGVQLGIMRMGEYSGCRPSRSDPITSVYGTVNVGNTPTVNVGTMPSIAVASMPSVNIGNTPNVIVSGTPNVSITNIPNVSVTNQPVVTVGNQPTVIIGNQPTVNLSGQPIGVSLSNSLLTTSVKANSYRIQTQAAGLVLRGAALLQCQVITWLSNMFITITISNSFSYLGHYKIELDNGSYVKTFLVSNDKIVMWPAVYPGVYFGVVDQSLGPSFNICVTAFDNHGVPDNVPLGLVVISTGPPQIEIVDKVLEFLSE